MRLTLAPMLAAALLALPASIEASTIYTYALAFQTGECEDGIGGCPTGVFFHEDAIGEVSFKVARVTRHGQLTMYDIRNVQLTLSNETGYSYTHVGLSGSLALRDNYRYNDCDDPACYREDTVDMFLGDVFWFTHDWYGTVSHPPTVVTGRGSLTQRFAGIYERERGSGVEFSTPDGTFSGWITRMELQSVQVPEPAAWFLVLSGLAFVRHRRQRL